MIINEKQYEKPASGMYVGVIADVIEKLNVPNPFKPGTTSNKLTICWVLDKLDSQGFPFLVFKTVNAVLHEKSSLSKDILKYVFPHGVPKPFDSELLIGRANQLVIDLESNEQGKLFANVRTIMPVPEGGQVPVIPGNFVRSKDKQKVITVATAPVESVSIAA